MNTSNTSSFNRRPALLAAGILVLAGAFAAGAQSVKTDAKSAVAVKRALLAAAGKA